MAQLQLPTPFCNKLINIILVSTEAAELHWGKWEENQALNISIMLTYVELRKKRKKNPKKQNRFLTALKINVLHQSNRRLTLPKEAKFSL